MTVSRMNVNVLVVLVAFFMAIPFASARPGNHDVREAVREAQQYQKDGRDSAPRYRFHDPHPSEGSSNGDASKRAGRMSPEERKALRQQINEAGQDLYYRRR